jgi:diacylglycerol kinase family enzyme
VGSSFTLRFEAPPAYEIDGEWIRAQSAELRIECLPRALEVLTPT